MTPINEDNLFRVIVTSSLGLLAVTTIGGFLLFSTKTGLGVLAGGLIAIINFFWLRNVLQRVLGLLPARPQLYAQMRYVARITITGVLLYLIITSGFFSLAGLLVGLSVIVATIIALSIYGALRAGG